MEIEIDTNQWRMAPPVRADGPDAAVAPDWTELRLRLGAAWSARRALAQPSGGASLPTGSFDARASARLAATGFGSYGVNPTASANRKPAGRMDLGEAGNPSAGDRG